MKKLFLTALLIIAVLLNIQGVVTLEEFLNKKEVKEVRVLKGEAPFEQVLEIMLEQPLDHRQPEGESFLQRIYISHADPSLPVVLITAGYSAKYYYTSELTTGLRANQLLVEHRYFGRSTPDSIQWQYLDTWQAASDHHRIIRMFKELYSGPWISTGISKGGQTLMYHSYYYPEDVQVRVPYVAPLNFGLEDRRIYSFLDQVGTAKERRKIRKFQKMALKHQDLYLPAFKEFSERKGHSYEFAGGLEKAYEYCVLEYSFAYWQWGYASMSSIPGRNASPDDVIEHMNRVGGFDYFSDKSILELRPFFYQALTEMGYYGYDLEAFRKQLRHVENPIFTFTLSPEMEAVFNPELSHQLKEYVTTDGENFIYIYGEYDTWSATAVSHTGDTNSRIFIKEGGSHRTRINNMPDEQKEEIYRTLESFLDRE